MVTFANHTCAVRLHQSPFSVIQNVFPLKGKDGNDTVFLYWLLKGAMQSSFYGGHWPKLVLMNLPCPPTVEQKRIACLLNKRMSAIEKAKAATEAQLEVAKALPAAYLKEAFNGPTESEWPNKHLGEIATFKNGINFNSNQKGSGMLTVDVLNMYTDNLYPNLDNLYRVNAMVKDECFLREGDILLVRSSVKEEGVGWTTLFEGYKEAVTFCGFIIRARLTTDDLCPEYVAYYLRQPSTRKQLISKSGKVAITNINQENLKSLEIPIAPLSEQKRIIKQLSQQMLTIRKATGLIEDQLNVVNKLPMTLLRQALTGGL